MAETKKVAKKKAIGPWMIACNALEKIESP